jgi:regulator of RNase E activity RraA
MSDVLTTQERERLMQVSVATISTCLYRAGVRFVCPHGIRPLAPDLPRMVGEAFTLRFIPMRDDIGGMSSYRAGGNVHQRAFEECPPGYVVVMDTRGETRACSCGDLLIGRLKARGCAGVVTDGGFRDTRADVAVYPGDIIVGDAEGVVVIPARMASRIAQEAYESMQYDTFAAKEVARGRSIVGLYPATDASRAEFERWQQGRDGS